MVVECQECSFFDYASGVTGEPGLKGPYDGPWTIEKWRQEVCAAVVATFGARSVDDSGKVAINVAAVRGSRPCADVVPSFLYYRYFDSGRRTWHGGSYVWDTDEKKIINRPAQQLANGKAKNTATGGRYKKFVRALKRVENRLVELGAIDGLPSYFMGCLVWNVANPALSSG